MRAAQLEEPGPSLAESNLSIWDCLADSAESSFPLDPIFSDFMPTADDWVLDYGCGCGRLTRWLGSRGVEKVIGVDASPRMHQRAKRESPTKEFIWTSSSEPKLNLDIVFSGVTVIGVLSSVPESESRRRFVYILTQVLASSGLLYIADFGVSDDKIYKERYVSIDEGDTSFHTEEGLLIHHFRLAELQSLLPESLLVIQAKTIPVKTMHGRSIPGHIIIAQKK